MDGIKSLSEYLKRIERINNDWSVYFSTTKPWYRGQSDFDWNLTPKIYRFNGNSRFERERTRDFILNASNFHHYVYESEFESMFSMQHYGVSTRLLDWSESSLIALFCAVRSSDLTAQKIKRRVPENGRLCEE
jgi:hypothetical protein